jgi:hypothetical protein
MSNQSKLPRRAWARLTTAARQVSDDRDTSAPYGFSTRVVALAYAREDRVASLLERFALRAVGFASLLAICSVALNYREITTGLSGSPVAAVEEIDVFSADDAVSIVLDLGD